MPGGLGLETERQRMFLKVYFFLSQHYILQDFLKNLWTEFSINVRDDTL